MRKPIHKFNSRRGATICKGCRVIISEELIEQEYCDNCKFNPLIFSKNENKREI